MEDFVEKLLDENNTDPIILYNQDGKEAKFQQVAIIPYNEVVYCLLSPESGVEGVSCNEVMVFKLMYDEETEFSYLEYEYEEETFKAVYEQYRSMAEEELGEHDI